MGYSVFDVLKYPNLAHLDPMLFPKIIKDNGSKIIIKTKEIIPHIKDGEITVNENGEEKKYSVQLPGHVSLWLVFDWNNEIKMSSLDGECEVSKIDSIVFLKINYPNLSDYSIEYVMDLSTPIDKYLESTYDFKVDHGASNPNEKIKRIDNNFIVSYDDMIANPTKYPIPKKITDTLRFENLIGGVIYDKSGGVREIKEVSVNGIQHKTPLLTYKGREIKQGLLNKISLI